MQLNQLYGYFGRKLDLIETVVLDMDDLADIVKRYTIKNIITLGDKAIVLKHVNLNYDLIKEINQEMNLTSPIELSYKSQVKSNVAIASAVTSYARYHMIPFKIDPCTYYHDTDSILTSRNLTGSEIGIELGQWKDELDGITIQEAIFLGIKQYGYMYLDKENKVQEKSVWAGVPRNSISFDELRSLSNGGTLDIKLESRFFKNFNSMDIRISDIDKTIRVNDFKKYSVENNEYLPPYVNLLDNEGIVESNSFMLKLKNRIMRNLRNNQ